MLHDLLRPLQCHDVQPNATPLEIKQLVDDEIDLPATSAPCDGRGTQLPQPTKVSRPAHAPRCGGRSVFDVRAAATNVSEEDPPEASQYSDRRPEVEEGWPRRPRPGYPH